MRKISLPRVPPLWQSSYLELAVRTGHADNSLVANDLRSDHGHSLALGRVDLARHDTASGLILGQLELAQTTAGPRAEVPDVVRDLHERAGDGVERTMRLDERVVRRERFELVRRSLELDPGDVGNLSRNLDVEALLGVQAL